MKIAWKALVLASLLGTAPALALHGGGNREACHRGSGGSGGRSHEGKDALLERFDKDGDGKLSKEERDARKDSLHGKPRGFGGGGKGGFHGHGRGHGGFGGGDGAWKDRILKRFDADGDGKLSKEERDAMKESWRDKFKGEGRRGHGPSHRGRPGGGRETDRPDGAGASVDPFRI